MQATYRKRFHQLRRQHIAVVTQAKLTILVPACQSHAQKAAEAMGSQGAWQIPWSGRTRQSHANTESGHSLPVART